MTESPRQHVLLFADASTSATLTFANDTPELHSRWRFVIEAVDGSFRLEASDYEPDVSGNRLELLPVVRGLEALDELSKVTLITPSRYVKRGLNHNIHCWRDTKWCWENFGVMEPIANHDLWQRVDRAMEYHEVACRTWRLDAGEHIPEPQFKRVRRRAAIGEAGEGRRSTPSSNRVEATLAHIDAAQRRTPMLLPEAVASQ